MRYLVIVLLIPGGRVGPFSHSEPQKDADPSLFMTFNPLTHLKHFIQSAFYIEIHPNDAVQIHIMQTAATHASKFHFWRV